MSPAEAVDAGAGYTQLPTVCDNAILSQAFEIIGEACSQELCSIEKLGELDQRIEKASLLGALRNRDLSSVHLFFPMNEYHTDEIFDWDTSKIDQIDTLKYVSDPANSIVFVIGKASTTGTLDHNRELSRDRARSVIRYVRNRIPLNFHHIHGAWVGREALQFDNSDARMLNLEPQDYRRDDLILNQAVHVFVYPCAFNMMEH